MREARAGPKKRRELRKLFEAGWNASDATRRQRGKRVSVDAFVARGGGFAVPPTIPHTGLVPFVVEYVSARERWRNGIPAVFPPGTYWLQRFAAVPVLET